MKQIKIKNKEQFFKKINKYGYCHYLVFENNNIYDLVIYDNVRSKKCPYGLAMLPLKWNGEKPPIKVYIGQFEELLKIKNEFFKDEPVIPFAKKTRYK